MIQASMRDIRLDQISLTLIRTEILLFLTNLRMLKRTKTSLEINGISINVN